MSKNKKIIIGLALGIPSFIIMTIWFVSILT